MWPTQSDLGRSQDSCLDHWDRNVLSSLDKWYVDVKTGIAATIFSP